MNKLEKPSQIDVAGPAARHTTTQVKVGNVAVGGGAPIVVQSMTNTDTADIAGTVEQVAALAPADVQAEVVAEVKPKTGGAPARVRPGGASMALIQAKKAAALKATQERERKKAEEAAAAYEARVAVARLAAPCPA